jgi:opacity protein-like surface antigen
MNLATVLLFGVLWCAPAIAETQFLIKSGPSWYTGDLGKVSSAGLAWGVSASFQPIQLLDIELAYQGSSNRIRDPRGPQTTTMYRNGGTAMAKVFIPPSPVVRPYAGIGLGGSYLATSYTNGFFSPTSTGYFALEFPFAVGLDVNLGALAIGTRATYRVLVRWSETIAAILPPFPRDPRGNVLDLTVSAGIRF